MIDDDVLLLRDTVDRLQAAYERRRTALAAQIAPGSGVEPEDLVDPQGRSILLDALTAIVNGRTALLNAGVGL